MALLTRRDVVVVASVSCIYGLGSPFEYLDHVLMLRAGHAAGLERSMRKLVDLQYDRNDLNLTRGTFRVRGDTLEVFPADDERAVRVEFFGDEVERIVRVDPLTGEVSAPVDHVALFPASHYVSSREAIERAVRGIETELAEQLERFERENKLLEAQRLRMRTNFDLEMIREVGFCNGIENYSSHFDGRGAGEPPYTLLDYFPSDFVTFLDESHVTMPQIGGMYEGDRSRKATLIEHGFRLPSAADNRPLRFEEFQQRVGQQLYLSATPGPYERREADSTVEQLIRPTGLVDPEVVVRPTAGQIDDLLEEIRARCERDQRVLVTTLTKRMAEDLTDYLQENSCACATCTPTSTRSSGCAILRALRLGEFDVLVGINLLREGLDLPEVSLVAILDADKEGFLRSDTSLDPDDRPCGTERGRSGHHVRRPHDRLDGAGARGDPRRRELQVAHNTAHGIDPQSIRKRVGDIIAAVRAEEAGEAYEPLERSSHRAAEDRGPGSSRPRSCARSSCGSTRRCTRRRVSCASSMRPGCATRSPT
jgi:excinuclease ABC subunit B